MTRPRRAGRDQRHQPSQTAQNADVAMTTGHRAGHDPLGRDNWRLAEPRPEEATTASWPPASRAVLPLGVLEAVTRALVGILAAAHAPPGQAAGPAGDTPLLDVEQTADLLRVSRMTVIRMADQGQLPAIVVRRGKVQKIRRIPRAFVERMIADAAAGTQVDMDKYAAAWLAEHARRQAPPDAANDAT